MKEQSVILLLLGLVVNVYSETCPPRADIRPCRCRLDKDSENILVSCNDHVDTTSVEDLKKVLNSLSGKNDVVLELQNLDLGHVKSDIFSGVAVKSLRILKCEVETLTYEDGKPAFSGLEGTLEDLVIYSSFRKYSRNNVLVNLQLGHLRHLKKMEFISNHIPELGNDWFEGGPSSLESLSLSHNEIEKIGDKAFANLPNLAYLAIHGNKFGAPQRSMFPSPAPALGTLDLDDNDFDSLPQDIFTDMPSLTQLLLSNNLIKRLQESTWKPVWEQLVTIFLEGNPLECDSQMNWMFNFRRPSNMNGRCRGPPKQWRKHLEDFIDDKGE